MIILVSGSRKPIGNMLRLAERVVIQAHNNDHQLMCGDADGIDAEVIRFADHLKVPLTVFGAYGRMRQRTKYGQNIPLNCQSYLVRDEVMAGKCDICVCLWNGEKLQSGTVFTGQYAEMLGKKVSWIYKKPDGYHPKLAYLGEK